MADQSDNSKPVTYGVYLGLDKLLKCQYVRSGKAGRLVHDEHLFIITHQVYELWFKQILMEINSVCELFMNTVSKTLDESKTLLIISRLNRVMLILRLLADQFQILETMTPLDFLEFRGHLETASGFQSLQFRLLENRLGIKEDSRVKYNQQHYMRVFNDPESVALLNGSITDPSLFSLVERWLERTPGLEAAGYNFMDRFQVAVNSWIDDCWLPPAMEAKDEKTKETKMLEYQKQKDTFATIFDPVQHKLFLDRGDRRLSHKAFQGALMISLYRDEPRFHQPFTILTLLTDIDSLLIKWRANHVSMVQRMIGSKLGTGGSSGYQYLRSTTSDRYKVFLDLFNLSAFLIPRDYTPPLTSKMKRTLSMLSHEHDDVAEDVRTSENLPDEPQASVDSDSDKTADETNEVLEQVTEDLSAVSFSLQH